MRNNDHCYAGFCQVPHDLKNLSYYFRIQRRCGFIEQHYARLHGQRARDGDALLLAAGQLRRILIRLFFDANFLQQIRCHCIGGSN